MKILLVNDDVRLTGGAERSLHLTAELLKEKLGEGNVRLYGGNTGETLASYLGRFWNFRAQREFSAVLQEFQPDLVHFNNITRVLSPAVVRVAKKFGIPTVMTVRDPHLVCGTSWGVTLEGALCRGFSPTCLLRCRREDSSLPFAAVKFFKLLWQRKLLQNQIDHFIVPSKDLFTLVKREFHLPEERCHYLPNFVDSEWLRQERSAEKGRILFVGRLTAAKGPGRALEAFRVYLSGQETGEEVTARLIFIGRGPEERKLRELVLEYGLSSRVEFLGACSKEEVMDEMSRATCLITPSMWLENHPRTVLEALSMGLPVIAPRRGGFKDLLEGSNLLVDDESAESYALKLEEVLSGKNMGSSGEVLSDFAPEKHLGELLGVYEGVVGVELPLSTRRHSL